MFTKSGKELSKIAIGTWKISKENIDREVAALKFYFDQGINIIDVVLSYDNGDTLDVLAKFLKQVKREDIFINGLITTGCKEVGDVEKQINTYLTKFQIDYLDCVTLHSPMNIAIPFNEYVKEIERLRSSNKFVYIGYSNLSPEQLNAVVGKIDYFEGLYNLECKINEDNGELATCRANNIPFYAFQPLRRNRTAARNYTELVSLAKKYGVTQNQVLINWLALHKKLGILIKSSNIEHIKENLAALSFHMEQSDYEILDKFRSAEFDSIPVTYSREEGKIYIASLPNQLQ